MKKILFLVITVFFICNVNLQSQNTLRWAADSESGAPYVFQDPENPELLIGFEAEIIRAIARNLGMNEVFVQNQWDGLIPGLNRNDYDVAINGLEVTDDRKLEVEFSLPYYITFQQIVVRTETKGINSFDDLRGKKVGTLKSSLAERILISAGDIIVRSYDSEVNSYTDLEFGRLDAVMIDAPVAEYYASWHPHLKLVGEPLGEMKYAIAIKQGNTELLYQINNALTELFESGELRKILERWNLWNHSMAEHLEDFSESTQEPTEFNRFIEFQKSGISFIEKLERYITFTPLFARAALMTMTITIASMILAVLLGLIIALMRVYAPAPISWLAVGYIEIIRGTPLLIQLFFIFYALPVIGISLSPFMAAVIGLGLNYAAYEAENYRAGLFSVPRGQMEAAISLGFSRRQALRFIIIPQAIRLVIPPITNDFISLLKDSSLVSVLAMVELTKLYGQLASTYYDYIGLGIIVAIIYLLLGLPFVRLSKYVENKFALDKKNN
jgi:polar amino acid transport system substrate-binding protein